MPGSARTKADKHKASIRRRTVNDDIDLRARYGGAAEVIPSDIHGDQLVSVCCFNATNDPTSLSELETNGSNS